jgi:hypothetical protein
VSMRSESRAREPPARKAIRGIFVGCSASAGKLIDKSKAHRAKQHLTTES